MDSESAWWGEKSPPTAAQGVRFQSADHDYAVLACSWLCCSPILPLCSRRLRPPVFSCPVVLRGAARHASVAYWASWASTSRVLARRGPGTVSNLLSSLLPRLPWILPASLWLPSSQEGLRGRTDALLVDVPASGGTLTLGYPKLVSSNWCHPCVLGVEAGGRCARRSPSRPEPPARLRFSHSHVRGEQKPPLPISLPTELTAPLTSTVMLRC